MSHSTSTSSPLFTPLKVGQLELKHRLVLAPLTRFRSPNHVPNDLVAEYYSQRASRAGTLLITEGTYIAQRAGGYANVPGIWSREQINEWRNVFSKVHEKKSFIYVQLWALGRQATPRVLKSEGIEDGYVSASNIALDKRGPPRPLTKEEIREYVELYAQAARNAIEAGADGIELHNANGYLPDQFLHANSNDRTDEYGGSIENRARFSLEIVDALIDAIGADRVGIRLSPWGTFGNVDPDVSPIPQFGYLISELERRARGGNRLAYIHLVEPRVTGSLDVEDYTGDNAFVRVIWKGVIIKAGALVHLAESYANDDSNSLVGIGRYFISNPDLVDKLESKIRLTPYDRTTFYTNDFKGYTDYPFANETSSKI